jgi:hypothetical protein
MIIVKEILWSMYIICVRIVTVRSHHRRRPSVAYALFPSITVGLQGWLSHHEFKLNSPFVVHVDALPSFSNLFSIDYNYASVVSDISPSFSVLQAQALSRKPTEAQQRSCQCQRSHFRNSGDHFFFFFFFDQRRRKDLECRVLHLYLSHNYYFWLEFNSFSCKILWINFE